MLDNLIIDELQSSVVFHKSITLIKIFPERVIWFHIGVLVELSRRQDEEECITEAAQDKDDHLTDPVP